MADNRRVTGCAPPEDQTRSRKMSQSKSARYFIVPRRTPDWRALSDGFRRNGRYTERDFIPEVLPPGFPGDLAARIDLWNDTVKLDFFTCRARLADIAQASWADVEGATLLSDHVALQAQALAPGTGRRRFLFVDDDDWFAPELPMLLEPEVASGAAIVRWAAPVFDGGWKVRLQGRFAPRLLVRAYLYARSRPILGAVYRRAVGWLPQDPNCRLVPGDHVLYTNNYAVTERYLRYFNDLTCVADHSDASKLALVSRLRIQSRPRLMLSVTNKHPCSAGVLGSLGPLDGGAGARLRQRVAGYVRRGRASPVPRALGWATRLAGQSLDLLESVL
jgi:hypothetical protein